MRFKKFIIQGYRGISDATEISIENESLIPIIGKNESGKTTCLEAINAFDFTNDTDNAGKHLLNVENLYYTLESPIIVSAEIDRIDEADLISIFKGYFEVIQKEFLVKYPTQTFDVDTFDPEESGYTNIESVTAYGIFKAEIAASKPIRIDRDLKLKQYSFPILKGLIKDTFLTSLGESFVRQLPYILYFDDFRERIPERVLISNDSAVASYSQWITYIDELFKQTKKGYSVFDLPKKQDSIRRSIVNEVTEFLNKVLAEEWSKYQFEQHGSVNIDIEYDITTEGHFLQFKIIENVIIDGKPRDRYFDISDRSKGFYWYFNFMVKLHFNPSKRNSQDTETVYLLDEPGSYLHSFALDKLAEQLKSLSLTNKVIYCTHFPNLLNPKVIPINSIRVAEKINKGKILLNKIGTLPHPSKNSAYQPVYDALEVKPPLIAFELDNIVLLEGIYDYYSFTMFTTDFFKYFPCSSASSIANQIPYMIFLGKKYLALWDDDDEGRKRLSKAKETFGEIEGEKFMVLSTINEGKNTRLEEYFDKDEIARFKSEVLQTPDISLEKVILKLFYETSRQELISNYFSKTEGNFRTMQKTLSDRFDAIHSSPQVDDQEKTPIPAGQG